MIKLRKISMVLCIITMLFAVMSLSGCSNNSITGIWAFVDDDGQVSENSKMYFNDDGSCNDIDYHGPTSADPVSYKVMSDGKLVFTMEWDGTSSFDLAQSEEEAMNDYHKYYNFRRHIDFQEKHIQESIKLPPDSFESGGCL